MPLTPLVAAEASAQAVDIADDDLEDQTVEDETDMEEAQTTGSGIFGSPIAFRAINLGATEQVLDFRDTGGLRTSAARPVRSASNGTAGVVGGSHHASGYPSRAPASWAGGASPSRRSASPRPQQCEPPAIDLDQVLQALLLRQGLLEDHEVMARDELADSVGASGSRPVTGAVTPSWRTLREMRQHGPLGELSEDAQTALLGGTLYAYGGEVRLRQCEAQESSPETSGAIVFRGTHAISTRGQRRNRRGGDSLESSFESMDAYSVSHSHTPGQQEEVHIEETAESLSQAGTAPAFANLLQLSLDRILQQSHRDSVPAASAGAHSQASFGLPSSRNDAGFRFSGISGGGMLDRSLLNSARSLQTISSSVVGPQSPNGSGTSWAEAVPNAMGAAWAEDIVEAASRQVPISREASDEELRVRELEAAIVEQPEDVTPSFSVSYQVAQDDDRDTRTDEGIVSVVGFDSPRSSMDSPHARPPNIRGQLRSQERDFLDDTGSVWGLGDTVRSSTSTVRSESAQHSARTIEAGLEGVTGMFARLASENFLLDESVTRSVRRVLQLGTVLTGQRLSEEEIYALPQVRFDDAEQQNCSICLEAYRRGEFLTSLRCGHFFHVDCLARWFQRSTQCPLCRSECMD